MTEKLNVAVIVDAGKVQRFTLDAIDAINGCDAITVYSCTNTLSKKRPLRHGFYYALNLVAIRNAWTRWLPVTTSRKLITETIEFESEYEGAWQRLPQPVVDRLQESNHDVILKFGMGLLRVPPAEKLPVPILSYHHGDPDHYRGRPAGFWEMLDNVPVLGQIIQVIGNKLDAGTVVAFAETKVHAHSYRATLSESYSHSPLLINKAIANAIKGTSLPISCIGRNYRLPANSTVILFILKMAARLVKRLFYGAFIEKKWRVATVESPGEPLNLFTGGIFPSSDCWSTLPTAKGYSFYADPFYNSDPPGILVEALNRRSGLGQILLVSAAGHDRVSHWSGHASYPSTIMFQGRELVVPEIASARAPAAFGLEGSTLRKLFDLDIEGEPRIVDPTLVEHSERFYLFGNVRSNGPHGLFLWSADHLDGRFNLHPLSPLRVSPEGSRMAGGLMRHNGALIRLGQDFRFGYGDGICAFEVTQLDAQRYEERRIGELRFSEYRGPHTLNIRNGELLFDYYRNHFSPLAAYRRAIARLKRQPIEP